MNNIQAPMITAPSGQAAIAPAQGQPAITNVEEVSGGKKRKSNKSKKIRKINKHSAKKMTKKHKKSIKKSKK